MRVVSGLMSLQTIRSTNTLQNSRQVGDSALIIRQLRDYGPPKNPRLLALYSQARRLADQLGVRRWPHHVRAQQDG
jgi:hypothetical protein